MDRKRGMNLYFVICVFILLITVTSALDQECTNSTLIEPLATTCVTNNFVAFSAAADDAAKCVTMDRKRGMNLYFVICVFILLITVTSALDQECTNSTLIEPLATTCVTNNFVAFSAAADDAAKCVIATGTILPCITTAIQDTYTVICTDAQTYIVIIAFRSTITTALQGFDVVEKCLPTLTCGDITSIAYYAARVCSEQLLEFQAHPNCSTLCGVATCYATAASEVSSCSVDDFEQTITDNAVAWQSATSETQTEMCCPSVGVVFNMEVTVYAMALVTGVFLKLFSMT